jgi:DNA recombination protein RmuC
MELLVVAVLTGLIGWMAALYKGRASTGAAGHEVESLRAELRGLADSVAQQTSTVAMRLEGIDSRMINSQASNQELASSIFDALSDVRRASSDVAEQARQFSSLQDLLKAPKARGGLGEAMLASLLGQILPAQSFSMQHRFSSGATVDAIVKMGGRIVPIDSKFPLANFDRMRDAGDDISRERAERAFAADVDRHISDIAARYIVPDEGTLDFAVMYVPAEGVYQEVLRLSHRQRPLLTGALERRVVPMSPSTMYGYLQTVAFGLRCLKIEERAEAILGFCGRLEQDIGRFATEYEVLGRHLGNARSKYDEGASRLDRFRVSLEKAAELADDPDATRPPLEAVGE